MKWKGLALAIMLAMVLSAQYAVWRQRSFVTVTHLMIAGNPTDQYTAVNAPAGTVIIAHGFAANKEMMQAWGYSLAARGFAVYAYDRPGQGSSTRRGPDNVRTFVDELVATGRAHPGKIALVGAGPVADDRVAATVAVPGIYDDDAIAATAAQLHQQFGTKAPTGLPSGAQPWVWIGLALAAGLGVMVAVAGLLTPNPDLRSGAWPVRVGFLGGLATVAMAPLSAVLAGVYLRIPRLHLALVDYGLAYFLVMAAVFLVLRLIWPKEFAFAIWSGQTYWNELLQGVGIFLGFVGALVPVIQMDLSHFFPTSPRILPMIVLAVCLWGYAVQEEGLKRAVHSSRGPWVAALVGFAGKLLILATWLGASALPNPPSLLQATIPVAAALLLLLESFATVMRCWRYSPAAIATLVALVMAWSVGVSLPLV